MDTDNKLTRTPLVSVCMPLYNEGEHICKSLSSITGQTYKNIEIIISDNASTDNTFDLCNELIKSDKRVFLTRQIENIGALKNFHETLSCAKGKYFMWASGHDLWSDNLIAECVEILEKQEATVLAYAQTAWIDSADAQTAMTSGLYDTNGLDFAAKFIAVLWGSMNPILGVIRKDAMPRLGDKYNFVGSDLVLLLELITKGHFACATSATFYRRQNRPTEDHRARIERYKSDTTKIAKSLIDKVLPLAKLPLMIIMTIISSKLKISEKIMLLFITIPSLPVKYLTGKKLIR